MFFQKIRTLCFLSACLCGTLSLHVPHAFSSCGVCYFPAEGAHGKGASESISSASMINSPTASTLGKNHASAGFTFDYLRFNSIPAGNAHALHHAGHDVHGKDHEESYIMHAGFGVLKDLDLYVTAPIVSKTSIQIESHRTLGRHEHAAGFGDMRFLAKYKILKKPVEGALLAGIKFPTGKTNAKDSVRAKIAPEQQPGTGSWNGEFGIVFSRMWKKRFSAATSFQYALKGEGAQDLKSGDVFQYNLGVSALIREAGTYPNLSVVMELNNQWALKDHSREEDRVFDSGGTAIFITPGFHIDITKHVSGFWGMPVPIYQNLGGEHEELKFAMLTGVSIAV